MSPRVVLVGPPGAGKSTVGSRLAAGLGVEFRDTDTDVEATAGKPISDIFVDDGEAAFRELERTAVDEALKTHDGVLAVGGGAVGSPETRGLLGEQFVIFLDIGLAGAVARTGFNRDRPLLLDSPRAVLKRLLDERRPLYQEVADIVVDTSSRDADEVLDELAALLRIDSQITSIAVGGVSPYDVLIGPERLLEWLPGLVKGASKVAVFHVPAMLPLTNVAIQILRPHGIDAFAVDVPDAEDAKSAEVAARCWARLGQAGMTRSDAIVGVGGGAVTDLAGFVAATWLRGVRWVSVPTTVLGMVDAAIGGKTGINTAEGKNLVGSFHPPVGVLCDLATLDTLPEDEYVTGLAEVVKAGFIADPAILDLIEKHGRSGVLPGSPVVHELVERAARVKADVVSADLRESGRREILNYGHTLAHAIENVEHYRWRHGAAVSVGLVFAAELGRLSERLDDATADRHRAVLDVLGLPTSYRSDAWPQLLDAMRIDKKSRGDRLRFVILDGLARPSILESPDPELLEAAYESISRR